MNLDILDTLKKGAGAMEKRFLSITKSNNRTLINLMSICYRVQFVIAHIYFSFAISLPLKSHLSSS